MNWMENIAKQIDQEVVVLDDKVLWWSKVGRVVQGAIDKSYLC